MTPASVHGRSPERTLLDRASHAEIWASSSTLRPRGSGRRGILRRMLRREGTTPPPPPPPPPPPLPPSHPPRSLSTPALAEAGARNGAGGQGARKRSRWDAAVAEPGRRSSPAARVPTALPGPEFFSAGMPQRDTSTWDEPDADFGEYVSGVVACRLGKYLQPGHPNRLSLQAAAKLHDKLTDQVRKKEEEAYAERQETGLFKAIDREKIDARIKEFVRDSIHRMVLAGATAG
ncbi:hypothetical protein F751_5576 [Auxenochlorella protothecoides]|uniref:Uncharacterized protein n=2 Tax=Auxenochlorella protothecoides TaxID=3075 RepID=A0A087SAW3_AUXPR|nr:hypothetical protein F751_5576 [Auxenochlorella protothecoides]KFM22867.1 hypothetical protein F751_5576 [Auxenochlorella protothecoides]